MKNFLVLGPALLLLGQVAAAVADEHEPTRNLVNLSVSADREVDSDLLVVRLRAMHEAPRQGEAADRVNREMSWALETAAAVSSVTAQTLDYRSNPIYEQRRVRAWRVQQSVRLESMDGEALSALLGSLQEKLAIESVAYEVSKAVREQTEAELIDEALERFQHRASRIAAAFGRQSYEVVNVNVGAQGYRPPPVAYAGRAMAMKAEVAQPAIEAGQQTISVSVNGTVQLSPN